jgi:ribosomal protein L21E
MKIEVELIDILLDYFSEKGSKEEAVKELLTLRSQILLPINEQTQDWKVGDKVRIKAQDWNRSKGIRGTIGTVKKVNIKNLKVNFSFSDIPDSPSGMKSTIVWNVPKTMLEKV